MMQIGEVAAQSGLSLRTVRYYEEVGLVVPSGRTVGGFRLYTDADLADLLVVKLMKPLNFTLEEMRELLDTQARLRDPELEDPERERSRERLASYVERATDRCAVLRARLEAAEVFVRDLRRSAAAGELGANTR